MVGAAAMIDGDMVVDTPQFIITEPYFRWLMVFKNRKLWEFEWDLKGIFGDISWDFPENCPTCSLTKWCSIPMASYGDAMGELIGISCMKL